MGGCDLLAQDNKTTVNLKFILAKWLLLSVYLELTFDEINEYIIFLFDPITIIPHISYISTPWDAALYDEVSRNICDIYLLFTLC